MQMPAYIKATKSFTYSLYILTGGFALAFTISGVVVSHVIEYFGLAGAQQGYMNSMINIGNTAAILLTIVMHIRLKKTSMLVLSGLLIVSMLLLTGLSVSFYMLLAVSLILGFGLGWIDSYLNSCVIDVNPSDSLKKQGIMHGSYGIGALLTPILIAAMVTKINWNGAYLFIAPVVLAAVVIYMVTLRYTGRHIALSNTDPPRFSAKEIGLFLKEKKYILLLAACFTYSIMQFGLFTWLVRYMTVQYGNEELGMMSITVMWIFTTISRFIAPRLKIDSMKLLVYGYFIAGIALFIGIVSNSLWVMMAMVGLGSLTTGQSIMVLINKSVTIYEGNSLLPTSAILLMTRIAGMVTPPALGFISTYSMQGSMMVVVIAIFIAGCFGLAFLRVKQ